MTLALSAYLTPEDGLGEDLFYLNTGSQDPNGSSSSYDLFKPGDLGELLALTGDVEAIAIADNAWEPELIYEGQRYRFLSGLNATPNYFGLANIKVTRGERVQSSRRRQRRGCRLTNRVGSQVYLRGCRPVRAGGYGGHPVIQQRSATVIGRATALSDWSKTLRLPRVTGHQGVIFPVWAKGGQDYSSGSGFVTLLVKAKPGQGEVAQAQMLSAVRRFYRDNEMVQANPEGRDFFIATPFEPAGANSIFIILGLFGVVALIVSSIGPVLEHLGRGDRSHPRNWAQPGARRDRGTGWQTVQPRGCLSGAAG